MLAVKNKYIKFVFIKKSNLSKTFNCVKKKSDKLMAEKRLLGGKRGGKICAIC